MCENWTIKNTEHWSIDTFILWCWRRLLRVPWSARIDPKGNQPWIFIERTDVEAEAPILWPPDAKSDSGKDFDDGKIWRQEEKRATKDKTDGWHHWLNGLEFQQTPGKSEGREAWPAVVHAIAKNLTRLTDRTTTNI